MGQINMKEWLSRLTGSRAKAALPILAFPSITPLGTTVRDLISSADLQAQGMAWIASHTTFAASVGFMDLSVEAECFGAKVRCSDRDVPTVLGQVVRSPEDAEALPVPPVGAGRTGICVDAIAKAKKKIADRPVLAGMIGPFSLAARLHGLTSVMMDCYDDPDTVKVTLKKATRFLTDYARAYQDAGADGILIAEPVSGLLSPAMEAEFSAPFVRSIVEAVRDEHFFVIYHNCGNNVGRMIPSLVSIGADAFHFGNVTDVLEVLGKMPAGIPIMGNIDPVGQFCMGTPASIRQATADLLKKTAGYPNFVISSGCDIPPSTPWENIWAFEEAVRDYGND